jgi:hypothetical protein
MNRFALILCAFALSSSALAEEGMWLLNQFPSATTEKRYGFAPDDAWLTHVRLSSARLAGGCSGSFVSPNGLVMTNHHCAHRCIAQLSTAQRDYVQTGFFAKTLADEVKCPEIEVNQLTDITDVSKEMNAALAGLDGKAYSDARKAKTAELEKACSHSDRDRCEVVSLYHGGLYDLYKYRRYQDVRLVFAPEFAAAFFGGDPDNFNFPRYDLDVSFLRVYEDGKPLAQDQYFRWSKAGAADGELTFVTGHPGGTDRQLTVAELAYDRDVMLPDALLYLAELRGLLTEFQLRGPEQKRIATDLLFGVENSLKALKGRESALLEGPIFAAKVADEAKLRSKLRHNPKYRKLDRTGFDAIATALGQIKDSRYALAYEEQGRGFSSTYFQIARSLVRGADELPKPNGERLTEYRDSVLPALTQKLFSTAPIHDELEIEKLTFSLTKLRELLGADDPFVRKVLGRRSPREVAVDLIGRTALKDVALRHQLWDGGKTAVDASHDPFIELVRLIDPDARAVRKAYEDGPDALIKKTDELIAQARFAALGTSTYPDATFTLRLSFGRVRGFLERGREVPPFTTFAGAFDRATGEPPFDLPQSWLIAKPKLKLDTPLDFCTTNDIIGGNSGSPVINSSAEIVGLIFDGNIHSLGGDFAFDERDNRAVAVSSEGLIEGLSKIYGADRIVDELRPKISAAH